MSDKKSEVVPLRKKVVLPLKVKIEMLNCLRRGMSFASIARTFNINESTVRSIKKAENKIRNSIASTSLSTKIVRDPAIEKMETALSLWIEDCNQKEIHLSSALIREKAKLLYSRFKNSDDDSTGRKFKASEGWFNKFKERQSLQNIKFAGEDTCTDAAEAENNLDIFLNLVTESQYNSEKMHNDEEICLSSKLKSKRSISKIEKRNENWTEIKFDELHMLVPHSTLEEGSASSEKADHNFNNLNLKNLNKGIEMANALCDFFMIMDPSVERNLMFRRKIMFATVEYQSDLKKFLEEMKQEKITKFFKPVAKHEYNY